MYFCFCFILFFFSFPVSSVWRTKLLYPAYWNTCSTRWRGMQPGSYEVNWDLEMITVIWAFDSDGPILLLTGNSREHSGSLFLLEVLLHCTTMLFFLLFDQTFLRINTYLLPACLILWIFSLFPASCLLCSSESLMLSSTTSMTLTHRIC